MQSKARLPGKLIERVTRWRPSWSISLSCVLAVLLSVLFPLSGQCLTAFHSAAPAISLSLKSAADPQSPADKPAPSSHKQKQADPEQMRKQIKALTTEIEHLRRKVAELERNQQFNSVHERLTKEEHRVEDLQNQLLGIAEKEAGLQSRMDELNEQLRPESLEHLQILGSLRPEQVREATSRRLTGEKQRIQAQLDLLQQNRNRLQSSLSVNELVIQRLRRQLQGLAQP